MTHEFYMQRCLELAKKGIGNVSPNPLVGAVIVHENQIIGEGYHQVCGEAHAEVNAVNSVTDKSLLPKSRIYVSLEPCSHFGKTPPCAQLILDTKIPEVIICNKDPHDKVAGKGIQLLKENGVKVSSGILEKQGEWINRRFFEFHRNEKPYVILKWAQNQNGLIDKNRISDQVGVNWITQPETKTLTHSWRAYEDAIVVGANTVINDAPSLDVRHASGENPLRVVIDPNGRIPDDHAFWKLDTPTLVIGREKRILTSHVDSIILTEKGSIAKQLLNELYQRGILSIMVEGGASTINSFITEGLWNEARILMGHNDWTEGLSAPTLNGIAVEEFTMGKDRVKIIRNT